MPVHRNIGRPISHAVRGMLKKPIRRKNEGPLEFYKRYQKWMKITRMKPKPKPKPSSKKVKKAKPKTIREKIIEERKKTEKEFGVGRGIKKKPKKPPKKKKKK